MLEDHVFNARRHLVQNMKKMDCPAQITVSQVMTFPCFKIAENSKAKRRELSAALKAVVAADPSTVEVVMEYQTCFSQQSDHQNHPTVGEVAELREPMDSRVEQQ
ncbi:SWI/SNF nucleosome remodeling complex component [Dissostichus eleginoides]|uniref:SWI/SNF nucleosome remodeling complex component n=1 Tax=Dissostichus eleginoides TaxID=100907 RepID=A0AAD9BY65_DISEL|nr:SWI/SNF nucleosome remodeling complex component [Dissostichus eleginoides]